MKKTVFSLIGIVILFLMVGTVSASAPFDIVGGCPDRFTLTTTKDSPTDRNGDGYVCYTVIKWICEEHDGIGVCTAVDMEIDNNVRVVPDVGGCPDRFTLTTTKDSSTDRNGDGYVCYTVIKWICEEHDGIGVCTAVGMEIDNNVKAIDK